MDTWLQSRYGADAWKQEAKRRKVEQMERKASRMQKGEGTEGMRDSGGSQKP